MTDLKKIIIDGNEVEVDGAMTLIQACEVAGIEVPRFCYHERLSIAGNCRMCLVEVVGGPPKPAASCAMQVRDLRPGPEGQAPVVKTNSPMVKKAREGNRLNKQSAPHRSFQMRHRHVLTSNAHAQGK